MNPIWNALENKIQTSSTPLIKFNQLMVTTVIGQSGAHVLPPVDLGQDTVHEVAQTLHHRSAVSRVTTWATMKMLKNAFLMIVQLRVSGVTGMIGVSVQEVVVKDVL